MSPLSPAANGAPASASCGERLASAGVARVFAACSDPSAFASGRGVERLRAAGVNVDLGLQQAEAAPLYTEYRPRDPFAAAEANHLEMGR